MLISRGDASVPTGGEPISASGNVSEDPDRVADLVTIQPGTIGGAVGEVGSDLDDAQLRTVVGVRAIDQTEPGCNIQFLLRRGANDKSRLCVGLDKRE